jgi:hypothetical protein
VKTVGPNALTAKVLCEHHNSKLSELDSAAKDVWCVMREVADRAEERRLVVRLTGMMPRLERRRYRLDGTRLERWCFKMMVDLVASGSVIGLPDGWAPRRELVDFVFGIGKLPVGCGVGLVAVIGEQIQDPDYISFELIRRTGPGSEPPEAEGFLIGFRGLRLAGSSTRPLALLHTPLNLANPEQVLLRPKKLTFGAFHKLVIDEIRFDWSGRYHNDQDRNVVRARKGRPAAA